MDARLRGRAPAARAGVRAPVARRKALAAPGTSRPDLRRGRRALAEPARPPSRSAPCGADASAARLRTPFRHVSFAPPLHRHEVTVSVQDVSPEALWLLWSLPRRVALYAPELEALGLRRGALGSTLTDVRLAYAFAESPLLPTLELWSRWRCVRVERGKGGGEGRGGGGGAAGGVSEASADVEELGAASNQVERSNGGATEGAVGDGETGDDAIGKGGRKKKRGKKARGAGGVSALPEVVALPAGSFAMAFEPIAGAPLSLSVIAVPAPPAGDASSGALFLGERSTLSPEEATRVVERAVDWRGAAWEEREKRRERDRRRNEERRARRASEAEAREAGEARRAGESGARVEVEGGRGDSDQASSTAGGATGRLSSDPPRDVSAPRLPCGPITRHASETTFSSSPPAPRGSLLTLRLSYFVPKHLVEVVGAAGLYADVDGRLEAAARRCRDDAVATRREAGEDHLASLRSERDAWRVEATRAMQGTAGPA